MKEPRGPLKFAVQGLIKKFRTMQNRNLKLVLALLFVFLTFNLGISAQGNQCATVEDVYRTEVNDVVVYSWEVNNPNSPAIHDYVKTTINWLNPAGQAEVTEFATPFPHSSIEIPLWLDLAKTEDVVHEVYCLVNGTGGNTGGTPGPMYFFQGEPSVDVSIVYGVYEDESLSLEEVFGDYVHVAFYGEENVQGLIDYTEEYANIWNNLNVGDPSPANLSRRTKSVPTKCITEFFEYTDSVVSTGAEVIDAEGALTDCDTIYGFDTDADCGNSQSADLKRFFHMAHWLANGENVQFIDSFFGGIGCGSPRQKLRAGVIGDVDCGIETFTFAGVEFETQGETITVVNNSNTLPTIVTVGLIGGGEQYTICNEWSNEACDDSSQEFILAGEYYIIVNVNGVVSEMTTTLECTSNDCGESATVNNVGIETNGMTINTTSDGNGVGTIVGVGRINSGEYYVICNEWSGDDCSNASINITTGEGDFFIAVQSADGNVEYYNVTLEECDNGDPQSKTSLEDVSAISNLTIYPNPSNGQFNLSFETLEESATVSVYDISGKVVFEGRVIPGLNSQVDLSDQVHGLYILRLTLDTGVQETRTISKL